MPRARHRSALALAAALCCMPAAAFEALTVCASAGRCGQVQEIDDSQMAAVAGKFTIAGEVVGMNLSMSSSWQAANGQRLEAGATLALDLSGDAAQARFGTRASASEAPVQGQPRSPYQSSAVSGGAGLQSVTGASQLIQVAGDGNGAANRATIALASAALPAIGGNGQPSASSMAANGAVARADIGAGGIALRLSVPAAGVARQALDGGNIGDIHQSIQISADRQQVLNQLQLQIRVKPMDNALRAAQGVIRSLNMLRGK